MEQLPLFDDDLVMEIRKQVIKEFSRIEGEDYDEWLEVIRVEVDYRLQQLRINKKKPSYQDTCKTKKIWYSKVKEKTDVR